MADTIFIPFPKNLYDKITIRSGGNLDVSNLAASEVLGFIEQTIRMDAYLSQQLWTSDGIEAWIDEFGTHKGIDGDVTRGFQWKELFLPNGTELRITYKGKNYYAKIANEEVVANGQKFTPSHWASAVADGTSRNAWRDIWVRFPGDQNWQCSYELRRKVSR